MKHMGWTMVGLSVLLIAAVVVFLFLIGEPVAH